MTIIIHDRTYRFPSGNAFTVPEILLFEAGVLVVDRDCRMVVENNTIAGECYVVQRPPIMMNGMQIENLPLSDFEDPARPLNIRLYDGERLKSVLIAIRGGTPLPPIKQIFSPPRRVVQDGFHRFLASLILGFLKIPVLTEIRTSRTVQSKGAWVSKSLTRNQS